ncbi:MAG: histidine kinase dimerization/phospho-acceptor domain-containing protein, partial [Desulfosarcinaceae bacterium]
MTADSIQALFNAVNAVGFTPAEDGNLTLIGEPPEWMTRLCPDLAGEPYLLSPAGAFTFLEGFIEEARGFWRSEKIGCRKSGLWIETDDDGQDHLLEASAVNTGEDKFLVIAHDQLAFAEKQNLIQKGREIALDRTLLQRMQAELECIRNQLESRVKLRTSELEEANRRLARELEQRKQLETERSKMIQHLQQSQKMEAIGTLAGGIAHDFNNILAAVLGFAELGLLETKPGTTLHNNLHHVLRAAHRARDLIRQILTFSRQSEPERKPIQLSAIAGETLKLLRASMSAMITIRQILKSDAFVLADPTQMHQVLLNLCTTAAHAIQTDVGLLEVVIDDR